MFATNRIILLWNNLQFTIIGWWPSHILIIIHTRKTRCVTCTYIHTCMHAGASEITYGAPRRNTTAPIEGFSQRAKNRGRARSQCRATARETHSTVYHFSPRSRVVRLHTGPTGILFRAISPRPIHVVLFYCYYCNNKIESIGIQPAAAGNNIINPSHA